MNDQNGDYSDLDDFGEEARPQHSISIGIETLADGAYDCEITSSRMEMVNGKRLLRIGLKTATGAAIEWACWLNNQIGINALLADMATLNFDAAHWGPAHGRPLSIEIPKAAARLPGLKFRGLKGSYLDKEKQLRHSFRVINPIRGNLPAMPAINQPPAPPRLMPVPPAASSDSDDEIPF